MSAIKLPGGRRPHSTCSTSGRRERFCSHGPRAGSSPPASKTARATRIHLAVSALQMQQCSGERKRELSGTEPAVCVVRSLSLLNHRWFYCVSLHDTASVGADSVAKITALSRHVSALRDSAVRSHGQSLSCMISNLACLSGRGWQRIYQGSCLLRVAAYLSYAVAGSSTEVFVHNMRSLILKMWTAWPWACRAGGGGAQQPLDDRLVSEQALPSASRALTHRDMRVSAGVSYVLL